MDGPGLGPPPFRHPPASWRPGLEEEVSHVRAQAGGGALVQHVVAALFPADRLLVQPRAEWDAGHLGIGALQVGSWQGRRRQEREMHESMPSLERLADPGEILALPGGFR